MSIVPYTANEENRVVLSLPTVNSLVLYDQETNSLEVIDNLGKIPGSSKRPSASSASSRQNKAANDEHIVTCPHCGFEFQPNVDNGPPDSSAITAVRRTSSAQEDFIDNDYFKLLQLHFRTNLNPRAGVNQGQRFIANEEANSQYVRLSETLFTQGYFNKFFRILKKIGTGSNGSVYKVEHVLDDVTIGTFALKKIGIGEDLANLSNILKEVKFLYNLSSGEMYDNIVEDTSGTETNGNSTNNDPDKDDGVSKSKSDHYSNELLAAVDGVRHLIKYNHVWLEIDNASTFGPKIPCVFILFEYCDGGDLEHYMNSRFSDPDPKTLKERILKRKRKSKLHGTDVKDDNKYLNNFEIFKIFKDICFGVYQLHKSHIIHRDLKPSNCLLRQIPKEPLVMQSIHDLEKFPDVVVSDFGESDLEGTTRASSGYTGTLEFSAPEVLFQLTNFNKHTDVYSMGLILYFLCFNKLPYGNGTDQMSVKLYIKRYFEQKDTASFLFGATDGQSPRPLCEFISNDNNSELLAEYVHLISMMCDSDPRKRPSVGEIIIFLVSDIWKKLEMVGGRGSLVVGEDDVSPKGSPVFLEDEEKLVSKSEDVDWLNYWKLLIIVVSSAILIGICISQGWNSWYVFFFFVGLSTRML